VVESGSRPGRSVRRMNYATKFRPATFLPTNLTPTGLRGDRTPRSFGATHATTGNQTEQHI
jgi:hypothetical protein